MGVSRTSRSLSQRQRNFANIYTHTGLARILKQGKINTKIDPKMAKIGKLLKICKLPKIRKCQKFRNLGGPSEPLSQFEHDLLLETYEISVYCNC